MKIFVPSRSQNYAETFRSRHSFISQDSLVILLDQSSLFSVINMIIETENEPVLLMHDDVYFNADFVERANMAVDVLNARGEWGIAGNAGTSCLNVGCSGRRMLRYISDPYGGPNFVAGVFPAETIDGNVMLLNVPLMRKYNMRVPEFSGFQLYDICLSIESIKAGLAVYITDYLLVYHASGEKQTEFNVAATSDWFKDYLENILSNLQVNTINGILNNALAKGNLDLEKNALRLAIPKNYCPHVKIVVRTQFKRNAMLKRCLDTISAFIAACGGSYFSCVIVTDNKEYNNYVPAEMEVLYFPNELSDSRFYLVQQAIKSIDSEYIWFIDDDDWMFPNFSEKLAIMIKCAPENSTFYIGAEHFKEDVKDFCNTGKAYLSRTESIHYYNPEDFLKSISGTNITPFSGAIFPRKRIELILENIKYKEHILYYEDYIILMNNMLSEYFIPITVPHLVVGISLLESGNTVSEIDRTKWNISLSTAMWSFTRCSNAFLLSSKYALNGDSSNHYVVTSVPKYGVKVAFILFLNKIFPWIGSKTASKIPQSDRTIGLLGALKIWMEKL